METDRQALAENRAGERGADSEPTPRGAERSVTRILLVANETVAAPAVRKRIEARAEHGSAEVFVVAPALTSSAFKHVAGDVDDAIEEARRRLDDTVRALRDAG